MATSFINLRYKLLPYLYSCFYEAEHTGIPVIKILALAYPQDVKIYESDYENQFMFGDNMLVCLVKAAATLVKEYLQKGNWYNFYTDEFYEETQGMIVESAFEIMLVFVKARSIV